MKFVQAQFPKDSERLIAFLSGEEWPFHVNARLSPQKIRDMLAEGSFSGSNNLVFWILDENETDVGFLRLFDLDDVDDGTPLFDLRVRAAHRGKGIGKTAVRWLTDYLFGKHPGLGRIMGATRADNFPMRKTFRACGYVKEGHYRKDWESLSGERFDTVKYEILREDWQSGKITPVQWDGE